MVDDICVQRVLILMKKELYLINAKVHATEARVYLDHFRFAGSSLLFSIGHYCLEGSPNKQQFVCGNSSVFCPRGSFEPTFAHEGFYSAHSGHDAGEQWYWDKNNVTCSVELPCEPGYYCTKGIKYPCPPGTFGWRYGMTDHFCGGQCAPGYYCPSYILPQPDAPPYTFWPGKPHTRPDGKRLFTSAFVIFLSKFCYLFRITMW